jgi:hypothetical protein
VHIPEPFWHTTILVKNRKAFERWLASPETNECPPFFFLSSQQNGRETMALDREEIERLTSDGFQQIRIGLNCIIY